MEKARKKQFVNMDQYLCSRGLYRKTVARDASGQNEQEGGTADSPPEMNYIFTQQVVKPLPVICSSPSSSSSSPSSSQVPAAVHLPPTTHTQTCSVAMAIQASSPWLVNGFGEALCPVVAPPPYSYDPNGRDLPRDSRVLQYYFNLGVKWSHQSCWQQQQTYPATLPETRYPYQHYSPYLSQDLPLHAAPPSYPETSRGSHQPPSSYPVQQGRRHRRRRESGASERMSPAASQKGSSSSMSPPSPPPPK